MGHTEIKNGEKPFDNDSLLLELPGHYGRFLPDGLRLVTAEKMSKVNVRDSASGSRLSSLYDSYPYAQFLMPSDCSLDGRFIAVCATTGWVKIWNAQTYELIGTIKTPGWKFGCAFSPDGNYIAFWGFTDAEIWRIPNELEPFIKFDHQIHDAAFSPDGKILLAVQNDFLTLLDPFTGKKMKIFDSNHNRTSCCAYSPCGRWIVSGTSYGTIRIIDARMEAMMGEIKGHGSKVTCCNFSPCGNWLISGSDDKSIKIWDVDSRKETVKIQNRVGLLSAGFSPSGERIITTSDRIRIWDFDRLLQFANQG